MMINLNKELKKLYPNRVEAIAVAGPGDTVRQQIADLCRSMAMENHTVTCVVVGLLAWHDLLRELDSGVTLPPYLILDGVGVQPEPWLPGHAVMVYSSAPAEIGRPGQDLDCTCPMCKAARSPQVTVERAVPAAAPGRATFHLDSGVAYFDLGVTGRANMIAAVLADWCATYGPGDYSEARAAELVERAARAIGRICDHVRGATAGWRTLADLQGAP